MVISEKLSGIFILVLLGISCLHDKSKAKHKGTNELCNKIYVETYTVFGSGAYGGDRMSSYLTDSSRFRTYIGTYDNSEAGYSFKCEGDTIIVFKVNRVASENDNNRIIKDKILSISKLKRAHTFE